VEDLERAVAADSFGAAGRRASRLDHGAPSNRMKDDIAIPMLVCLILILVAIEGGYVAFFL
jgi:hypothetical protein